MSELLLRDVDATPVAWREAGSGPLVLFLHGLGTTRTGFDPQLAALASHYRCAAWDMPAYGASPPLAGGLSFSALGDAVAGLIDALGERHAHVVGLSLGGQIALHTALRHPARVRSLALLDSSPAFGLDGTDPEAWKRLRLDALDAGADPGEHGGARAAVDHGARRRSRRAGGRGGVDGAHLQRRPARRRRVPAEP